jgi:hypothetical protein
MEAMNFETTGGAFGVKRVLGTFTLHTAGNGRVYVTDDYQNDRAVGFGYDDAASAIIAFKYRDEYRLTDR